MDCAEANRQIEPFLKNTQTVYDTWQYLKHVKECPTCRDELDLESIITAASDPAMTDASGYDFSHHLEDLIRKKEQWVRACLMTDVLDVLLVLLLIIIIIFKIFYGIAA